MAGFMFSPFSAYQHYGHPPAAPQPPGRNKQATWKSGKSAEPADYLDNLQRAQLKAILSQVNPNLTPRLRRANTKEVGVQVNPRVDVGVQCSLGPRTLRRPPPPPDTVRFSRPLAVYSPVLERRLLSLRRTDRRNGQDEERQAEPEEREEEEPAPEENLEESGDVLDNEEIRKSAFQFLEQKYGYFHCKDCKTRWESAYVWCISGSNKVYFKQLCRKCQKGFNPYRVEAIQCQACSKTRCSCPQKKRHIDLKRPHRQELCGRCKNKRLSCDNTYSFKYIV
ncbi:protein ZAR1-like [Pyxicephalus adspersus]|uniref:3CxxC-type domain-containing protein n=1 Tax=Pyxicephalus adspersus TaxID=30357 RepID=A0AAV3B860_PYXAD|nr:TPA: hypothetical protein GDO54_000388 [Pyxicephalus adspersus]